MNPLVVYDHKHDAFVANSYQPTSLHYSKKGKRKNKEYQIRRKLDNMYLYDMQVNP